MPLADFTDGAKPLYEMPLCQGPSASRSLVLIWLTHFTLRTPTCPGTIKVKSQCERETFTLNID